MFDRDAWEGRKPLTVPSAELIADARLITVGWSVWSNTRRKVDEPLGGVVCGVDASAVTRDLDPETGEIVRGTAYRVRDPFGPLQCQWVYSSEVSLPDGVEPPEPNRLYRLIRRMTYSIGTTGGRKHGPTPSSSSVWLTATEAEMLTDCFHLLTKVLNP